MYAYWKLWVDVLNIGIAAQRVMAMRLAKIAKGGAAAEAECRRMVSEKFLAAAAAGGAAAAALVGGKGIDTAARLALTPIERAVRDNRRRLGRAERFAWARARLRHMATRTGVIIHEVKSIKDGCKPSNDPGPGAIRGLFLSIRRWRSHTEPQVGT